MNHLILNDVIIREYNEKDLYDLYNIEKLLFNNNAWSLNNINNELKLNFSKILVAEYNKIIIGYIIVWHIADEIHIMRIGVKPDFQKNGIGKLLIKKSINIFDNSKKILLEVASKNIVAINFYSKLGFVKTGERKNYYINDNAILMELNIQNENS